MNRPGEVDEVLRALVGRHSVVSAILASEDGDVVAVQPVSNDAEEASATAQWAAEQIERLSGLRAQLPRDEFSVLLERRNATRSAHCYLHPVGDHVLVLMFSERDSLAAVRQGCKTALQKLAVLLTPES